MNKKWIKILATLFVCTMLAFGVVACGDKDSSSLSSGDLTHEHEYTTEITAPTCTAQGFTTYTCACGNEYIADYVNALNHDFTNYVSDNNATCTEYGTETARCNRVNCNQTDTRTDEHSALNHDFQLPTYTWEENRCTATRICTNDNAHVETETVTAEYVKDTDATCIVAETGHYEARFENVAFEMQETDRNTVVNGEPLNHKYATPIYVWNEYECIATRVCTQDNVHIETETVVAVYVKDTDATCDNAETGHYKAVFENHAFTEQNTEKGSVSNGCALDHDYNTPTYFWDGQQCTAKRVCENDVTHVENETVIAIYVQDQSVTCTTAETGHYWAIFANEAFTMQTTPINSVTIGSKLAHSFLHYKSDKNATYDIDGTMTAFCEHACGTTHTLPETGSKLKDNKIDFTTLSVGGVMGLFVSGKVSNSTTQFNFDNEISVSGSAIYNVYDVYNDRSSPIENKTVDLTIGDNTFYVVETVEGYYEKEYTVTIRRRPIHTVIYTGHNNETIATQKVEEDSIVSIPNQVPTRIGYTFDGWDYEFANPITDNKNIPAKWLANTNTPYKIEYYLQNLENDDYTLEITENKVGTTDEIVYAEIKTFSHFTFQVSYNDKIFGDGSTVLEVYYTRNYYTVTFDGNGGTTLDGNDTLQYVKYQDTAVAPSFIRNGYDFDGWDREFTNISENMIATAKWKIATYKVTYDLKNGTLVGGNNPTTYTVESEAITLKIPRLKNYGFLGWSDGEKYIFTIERGSYGDLTLTAVWEYAFDVTGDKLNSIKNSAKTTCYEMEIPDNVTEIGENVFANCRALTSVTIRNSIKKIGEYAFRYCSALKNVHYLGSIDEWVEIWFVNGYSNPLSNGAGLYINGGLQRNITINAYTIAAYAFCYYSTLTNVILGDNVMVISRGAFYGCDSLTDITMGENVVSIEDFAFYSCEKLKQIDVSTALLSLGEQAFGDCKSLITFTISKNLNELGTAPFAGCESLQEIFVDNNPYLASIDGNLFIKDLNDGMPLLLVQYAMGNIRSVYTIPDGVFEIADMAFMGAKNLGRIEMSNNITAIGEKCFYDCQSLKEITLSNDLVSLSDGAFAYCEQLEKIEGGESLETIGSEAFIGCSSLKNLQFLSNVKHINSLAFAYCSSIEEFEMLESIQTFYWDALYGCDNLSTLTVSTCILSDSYDKGGKVLLSLGGANIENLIIKEGFTSIDVIRGGENIKNISLPNSLTIIEDYALTNLSSLQSINLENVTEIEDGAFVGCSSLASINLSGVISIGASAFTGCSSLASINLGDVISIGASAFAGCSSLVSINLENVTSIGAQAFAGCTSLENVVIGSGIIEIGEKFFYNCKSLKELTLPSTLRKVGERLFEGACVEKLNIGLETIPSFLIIYIENVGEIELLDTVRTIETHAFSGIANGRLFLNDNVTNIDGYAFADCEGVEKNVYDNCKYLGSKQNPYMVLMEVLDESITHYETELATKFIYTDAFYKCSDLYSLVLNENIVHISGGVFSGCRKLVEVYNLSDLDISQYSYENGFVGAWAFDIYDSKDAESKIVDENGFKVYNRNEYEKYVLSYEGTNTSITVLYSDLVLYAFRGNDRIEEVILREYWGTTIWEGAFMGCTNLKSVKLCNCIRHIEAFAFAYCTSLTDIMYNGTIAEWESIRKNEGWNEGLKATYVRCTDGMVSIID